MEMPSTHRPRKFTLDPAHVEYAGSSGMVASAGHRLFSDVAEFVGDASVPV
jgi:hypothetical protein